MELQSDHELAMWHVSRLYNEYVHAGQPVPEQLSRDMERIATALQQQRHPGLAAAEHRDADSTAASSSGSSTRQTHADQQPVAVAAAVPAFTGMRGSIPIQFSSDSEEEAEEGVEVHEPVVDEPQASSNAQGSSDAVSARGAIAVVEYDSSSDEEDDAAAVQEQCLLLVDDAAAEPAPAAGFAQPPSEAGEEALEDAADAVALETATAATIDEPAADESWGIDAVVEQQQQQRGRGVHQGSRSAVEGGVMGTADDAAGQALEGLLGATSMSQHQHQQAGSSNSSDSSSSSGSSIDDFVDAAQIERLVQRAQRQQQQQLEGTSKLAQVLLEQRRKQQQQGRQQQWQLMRQQWRQRLQQEHPQAVAELTTLHDSEVEILQKLFGVNGKGSSSSSSSSDGSDNKVGTALYKRNDGAATSREAGELALKQGNAQAALKHYNAAVAALPIDARGYAGRAQVWLRLKRPQHAEQDCGVALLLATKPADDERSGLLTQGRKGDDNAVDLALVGRVRRTRAAAWKELGKLKEAVGVSLGCSDLLLRASFW
jgi:tetratricopeptide (TPR) repeat protein